MGRMSPRMENLFFLMIYHTTNHKPMKLYQEQDASFSVRASHNDGENILSIHAYDRDDQPLDVKTISYPSQTAPVLESFCALENAMALHGIEADIRGQDGTHYHGTIIN